MTEQQFDQKIRMQEEKLYRLAYHETISREGQMVDTARITLPFTLDADSARESRMEVELPEIALENCMAHYEKISITPLSTLVQMRLYPHENTPEAVAALGRCYGCPTLSIPEDQGAEWLPMEGEGFAGGGSKDGRLYYEIQVSWGGMTELPDTLYFSYDHAEAAGDGETERLRRIFIEKTIIPLK